jgi:hypothetical protein
MLYLSDWLLSPNTSIVFFFQVSAEVLTNDRVAVVGAASGKNEKREASSAVTV